MLVGIRLGATTSTLAILQPSTATTAPEIIADEFGDRAIPTCVAFSSTSQDILVGSVAKQMAARQPQQTLFAFPLLLGRRSVRIANKTTEEKENQTDIKNNEQDSEETNPESTTPTIIEADEEAVARYQAAYPAARLVQTSTKEELCFDLGEDRRVSVELVTRLFLRSLLDTAEAYAGRKVSGVVLTVSDALFQEETERKALQRLCSLHFHSTCSQGVPSTTSLSPIPLLQILPDAVSVLCGYDDLVAFHLSSEPSLSVMSSDKNVVILDWGGHTLTVSLVALRSGTPVLLHTHTEWEVGGRVLDLQLAHHFADEFKRRYRLDPRDSRRSFVRLQHACEHTRRMLTQLGTSTLFMESMHEGLDFSSQALNRSRFEAMGVAQMIEKVLGQVERRLQAQSWSLDSVEKQQVVDEVLLVGGCALTPIWQATVQQRFGLDRVQTARRRLQADPSEVAAIGAAKQAGIVFQQLQEKREGSLKKKKVSVDEEVKVEQPQTPCLVESLYLIVPVECTQTIEDQLPPSILSADGLFMSIPLLAKHHPLPAHRSFRLHLQPQQTDAVLCVSSGSTVLSRVCLTDVEADLRVGVSVTVDGEVRLLCTEVGSGRTQVISI